MSCEGACLTVTSPLVGAGQGERYDSHCVSFTSEITPFEFCVTPLASSVSLPPLSLSLPRKGGGNDVALLCPARGFSIREWHWIPGTLITYLYILLCHDSHSAPQRVLLEGRVATRELAGVLPTLTRPGPVTVACSVFLDCTLSTLMRSPCAPGSSA
jgi:hypothetical protein